MAAILGALLLLAGSLRAQTVEKQITVFYSLGSSSYEPRYRDNAARLEAFINEIKALQDSTNYRIAAVSLTASASADGTAEINSKVSNGRLVSGRKLMEKHLDFSGAEISEAVVTERWESIRLAVLHDESIADRDTVISIINDSTLTQQAKERSLKRLNRGRTWKEIYAKFLPERRMFRAKVVLKLPEIPRVEYAAPSMPHFEAPVSLALIPQKPGVKPELWTRQLRLKTNAVGLGLLVANVAAEVDINEVLSFHMPLYYSGVDYFSRRAKFRTIAIQPELRYNFRSVKGLFAGAHFDLAWYNIAASGNYRYQDHDGSSPLIGGGLGLGYRLPVSSDGRWAVEFALGAGVYRLHYDSFYNEPNGAFASETDKVVFGLDNAAVSLCYSFDLRRRSR